MNELLNFEVKITAAANDTCSAWREGTHDDLVLALNSQFKLSRVENPIRSGAREVVCFALRQDLTPGVRCSILESLAKHR